MIAHHRENKNVKLHNRHTLVFEEVKKLVLWNARRTSTHQLEFSAVKSPPEM
jgi:hypothetical protein